MWITGMILSIKMEGFLLYDFSSSSPYLRLWQNQIVFDGTNISVNIKIKKPYFPHANPKANLAKLEDSKPKGTGEEQMWEHSLA